jgi:hypothetical protein
VKIENAMNGCLRRKTEPEQLRLEKREKTVEATDRG